MSETWFSADEYMMPDGRTHRFWWTWIPAHPISRQDKWYKVLERVFADHTTNYFKDGNGRGFYTEHLKGKSNERLENHQAVGVFQTFSALPSLSWADALLRVCEVPFRPPLTSVRWQYQMQGKDLAGVFRDLHPDVAMRVGDAGGPESEIVIVVEAKRKGGAAKDKDRDDPTCYTRLEQLEGFRRKHVVFLVDASDLADVPPGVHKCSWQQVAEVQIAEAKRLALPAFQHERLCDLLQDHLSWYGITPQRWNRDELPAAIAGEAEVNQLDMRLAALFRGLETVVRARRRLPVHVPPEFAGDPSFELYKELPMFRSGFDWRTPIW